MPAKTASRLSGAHAPARSAACWGMALAALIFAAQARANPADYIYMPRVEYGERELDLKYGTSTPKPGNPGAEGGSVGIGYGAGEHWFTEIYLKRERNGNQNSNIAEWENKFQLTETGEYPVDLGLITEIEAPLSANAPWEVTIGPLLQTDFDKLQLNGNVLFQRAFGRPDESGVPYTTNLGYQWQVKYRWQQAFEYGLQGIGGMGTWNNWSTQSSQSHLAGPAVMGRVLLGGRNVIQYNAGWLLGVSRAAPSNTFRLQVEYEF